MKFEERYYSVETVGGVKTPQLAERNSGRPLTFAPDDVLFLFHRILINNEIVIVQKQRPFIVTGLRGNHLV
jgi:hypothetical protein